MASVLVLVEALNGKLNSFSLEALSLAAKLSSDGQFDAVVVESGDASSLATEAGRYGAKRLHVISGVSQYSAKATALGVSQVLTSGGYRIVVAGAGTHMREILPQLAVSGNMELVSEVMKASLEGSALLLNRPLYTGKVIQSLRVASGRCMLALKPKQIDVVETGGGPAEIVPSSVAVDNPGALLKDILKEAAGKIDLQGAEVIVSGGRGMGGPENWHFIEEFAAAMGAATGASRAVVDAGWRPHSEQVGQTGKIVTPKLYFAFGISGAIQHLVGMQGSKYIVAINRDPEAPIFKKSDYGIVGDALQILPKLTAAVKS